MAVWRDLINLISLTSYVAEIRRGDTGCKIAITKKTELVGSGSLENTASDKHKKRLKHKVAKASGSQLHHRSSNLKTLLTHNASSTKTSFLSRYNLTPSPSAYASIPLPPTASPNKTCYFCHTTQQINHLDSHQAYLRPNFFIIKVY